MAPRPKWHLWHCTFKGCDHVQLVEVMYSDASHAHKTSGTTSRLVAMKFIKSFYTKLDGEAAVKRIRQNVRVAA